MAIINTHVLFLKRSVQELESIISHTALFLYFPIPEAKRVFKRMLTNL